jgi:hypothetical protein
MSKRDLLFDVTPVALFALAALVFAIGGATTGKWWLHGAALLAGLVAVYQLSRLRSLYID